MPVLDVSIAGQHYGVWNLDELTLKEAFALKQASGLNPMELDLGLGRLDPACWQAIVWHLRRKTEPRLRLDQIDFKYGDIDAELVREEPEVPSEAEAAKGETSASAGTTSSTSSRSGSATPRRKSTR